MNKITRTEYLFLIKLLELKRGFNTIDVEVESANLSSTEIYFLQQKLEKIKNDEKISTGLK